MAIRKNVKRIDPRYFLNETTNRGGLDELDEAAPGSQIFEPGSEDESRHSRSGTNISRDIKQGETSGPSAFMADVTSKLSDEDLALAIYLESIRTMLGKSNHQPYGAYEKAGVEPPPPPYARMWHPQTRAWGGHGDRAHMMDYFRNLGIIKDGKIQFPKSLGKIGGERSNDRRASTVEGKVLRATWGENLPNEAYVNGNMVKAAQNGMVKPYAVKDPISGDTFTFTPMLSRSGMVASVQIS